MSTTYRTAREANAAAHAVIIEGWIAAGTVADETAGWAEIAYLDREQPNYLAYLREIAAAA